MEQPFTIPMQFFKSKRPLRQCVLVTVESAYIICYIIWYILDIDIGGKGYVEN